MKKENESPLRKALLLTVTTVTALGVSLGLPVKKALAASLELKRKPAPALSQPRARLTIFQPRRVAPSTVKLLRIAHQALSDNALAERIFREPDAVASKYHLSRNERRVLHHMDRTQFQAARTDAARLVATRLAAAKSMRLPPGATNTRLITERMIVGRAILAAVGRSYLAAANAHQCCPWGHAIELGINSDPAYYNSVFKSPSAVKLPAVRPGVQRPR